MADITLAEFNGRVWLIGGEALVDDLLANTLGPEISIELVHCEDKSEVNRLWLQLSGEKTTFGDPWMIHPGIVQRIRRQQNPNQSLFFAEWSAAIDNDSQVVIASVAALWTQNQDIGIDLIEFLDPEGPKVIADLSRLRAQVVEDALVKAGVARDRIGRDVREPGDVAGMAQESQRIDLAIRTPDAA